MALVLGCACLATYANSFAVPFVFDDEPSIIDNPTLRHLATAWQPLPGGSTVAGRPLLNLTFALNFQLSGLAVWSYHGVNLAIHLLAALVLFGFSRLTLAGPTSPRHVRSESGWIAAAIALLWAVHPAQAESVTYVAQRAESLGGLLLLLTLYGFARGAREGSSAWQVLAVAAAWAGAAAKETTVVAPVLALLYDRSFLAGSFASAWRIRRGIYLGLASAWLLAGALVWLDQGRGDSAGFDGPARWWEYAALQLPALVHYVHIAVWPSGLVFDFGPYQRVDLGPVLAATALVVPLAAATLWALVRRPALGFLGAAFFLTLAPSSSVVPIASQIAAEHRLYVPLAAVVSGFILALWQLPRRLARATVLVLAGVLATLTWHRNEIFADPVRLWSSAVQACPDNPRAHVNLGEALVATHRLEPARAQFETALQLQPNYVTALYDLGTVLLDLQQPAAAVPPLTRAIERLPTFAEAAYNLGAAYSTLNRPTLAAQWFHRSVQLDPRRAKAHYNLANTLIDLNQVDDAIIQYEQALTLDPQHANAHFNLGNALLQSGRADEAIRHFAAVLRLHPDDRDAARLLAEAQRQARQAR